MVFEAKQLCKSFGEKRVLEGVDLLAEGGKALGLLGRNGAGKTTSIRIIMGVFPADSGQVLVDGAPIDRNRLSIGYLPEEHGLYPKLPVDEQLVYLAQLRGVRPRDARQRITKWLGRLGIEEYTHRKLDTLSKGNQQKIQLAAALITDPDFVILDEPFSGLDPVNAALLKDVVKELIALGKIVLFSSHQMGYVEEFCDSIAILHKGGIVCSGNILAIKRAYVRDTLCVKAQDLAGIEGFAQAAQDLVLRTEYAAGQLRIILRGPEHKQRMMSALTAQGFDIDTIAVYEPSLNDIFVEYTGKDESEQKEVRYETA